MGNLAVSKSQVLSIDEFNIDTFFFTNSYLFKKIKLNKNIQIVLEAILATSMLIVMSPVLLAVAAMIKIFMPGPIFYKQIRVGENGEEFKIYKFRSMINNAEALTGPTLATKSDPRITRLGSFLRASHLDEFPQLINVLKGEMSFVGPRPERPVFVNEYEVSINNYRRRREVKPGITGLAQVCLPYDATAEQKIQYDVFYINNKESLMLNVLICFYTAQKMVNFVKYK